MRMNMLVGLWIAACCAVEAVAAAPAFKPEKKNAWDFWFAKDGDTYHAFYLEYPDAQTQPDQSRRHGGQWVGHAVSKDLVHWEARPTALKEAPARGIATGSCVRDGDRWCMLVTYQGFTLAESADLERWNWAGKAVFPACLKAEWKGEILGFRLLADPYVYPEKIDGWWYAAINAQIDGVPKAESGAQVLMRSKDLLHWESHRVISFPRKFERMETAQFWEKNGRWYLHFGGAGGAGGSHVYSADRFDGPYEEHPWSRITLSRVGDFYLGKRLVDPHGEDVFLAGQGYCGISLPQSMRYASDGKILFGTETPIAHFEGSTYGEGWTVEGTAFGTGPARGTLPGQMAVSGFAGKGLVNSFHGGDAAVGVLTSPRFMIDRKHIAFLMGGGGWKGATCMNLLVDGKIVRTATGPNTQPGGSEELEAASWDVSDMQGKEAQIQIVDAQRGCWGHINVDALVLCDQPPVARLRNVMRTIAIEQRWLQVPIKNGGAKCRMEVRDGTHVLHGFDVELAEGEPDWWAPLDVGAWQGKSLTLWVNKLSADSKGLDQVRVSETAVARTGLYEESLRPQLHFSPMRGWNNDPNGLVFYKGEYHLFFQHNPYGVNWGNMHWGHAVSTDLVHWKEVDEALYPDALGPMFSGSAVVDSANTSGFGKKGEVPLVLIYTAAGNPATQCMAYSLDGRHFTKYTGNPILSNITPGNRDPKVFWHVATQRWIMVLYVGHGKQQHTVQIFASANLREWQALSCVNGDSEGGHYLYECPDLFELPVIGGLGTRWVLFGANGEYAVGAFDGITFKPEEERLRGHGGSAYYAAQTFSDLPDGSRVLIGWLQTPSPGMPFNQAMTLPQELGLVATERGVRLTRHPVRELESLRQETDAFGPVDMAVGTANPLAHVHSELIELRIACTVSKDTQMTLGLRGIPVRFDASKQELWIGHHRAAWPVLKGQLALTIFVDRTSIEVFSQDGLLYAPVAVIPDAGNRRVAITVEQGTAQQVQGMVYTLKSCWK